jgi:YgiT-type zinc finger domain-containing protein
MKCPSCGAAKLVHDTRDMPYTYKDKGETTAIPAVPGDCCSTSGEAVLGAEVAARVSAAVLAWEIRSAGWLRASRLEQRRGRGLCSATPNRQTHG